MSAPRTAVTDDQRPLYSNAWLGDRAAKGVLLADELPRRRPQVPRESLAPPARVGLDNWRDPRVGWGLILPARSGRSAVELATADDAPAAIRRLVAHRNHAPVFRYEHQTEMLRYYGAGRDLALHSSGDGLALDRLPRYLLIYASPAEIPWEFQYRLGVTYFVGRLDLTGDALERYVDAVITNWSSTQSAQQRAVIWSIDLGPGDITRITRASIGDRLQELMAADAGQQVAPRYLRGTAALLAGRDLIDALASQRPGLIVTTSHGQTWPLDRPEELRRNLGLPVDSAGKPLAVDELRAAWEPDGAIWYAHACCSAGCDARSRYSGLFRADSSIEEALAGIAALGAMVAPLPRALLGADRPLRAFIGHVEPTFDRTVKYAQTGQFTTDQLVDGLYALFRPEPVGMALHEWRERSGGLSAELEARTRGRAWGTRERDLLLSIYDRQSTVLLGDPAVALVPPWASAPKT